MVDACSKTVPMGTDSKGPDQPAHWYNLITIIEDNSHVISSHSLLKN